MKVKFTIGTGFAGCTHETVAEIADDITDQELEEIAKEIAWEYISVSYNKISE